jgi:hypothetical protein
MKLYWSINSIPELADLPKEKRKEVWKSCHIKCFLHWQIWASAVLFGLGVAAGSALGEFYYGRIGGTIGAAIAGGIVGIIGWEIKVSVVRPLIRVYLNSHDKI